MPTSSFTGGSAGSGINKNVNNVIYVQDKGNTTFEGYITIDGNLTVNGTTTTIDSVTLTIEDPVITLAKNANLNPTASTDAGLFLQRGSTENPAVFIWNETLNQFELATIAGATSATTNFTGLTKTYSTLKAGIFSGSSATFTGVVTSNGLSLTTDGQVSIKKPTDPSTTSAILLNADRTGSGQQADIIALEVERGALTNSYFKWDETNDRWDFNFGVYFNTDSQIKLEKFTAPATTPAILLNSDYTGNPDVDGSDVKAIEVERDILANSYIQWDETNDRWKAEPSFYSYAIEGGSLSSLSTITAVGNISASNANVGGRTMTCAFLNIDSYYDQGITPLFIRGILLTEGDFKLEGLGYSSTETYTNKVFATYKKAGSDPNFQIDVENGNLTTTGQATFENNLIPVYIYVKYNSSSQGDNEYFYIFSTNDNGITRDVVRLSDLDSISENTGAGYYRYRASAGSTYSNTTPPTINGIAYLDPNKTYYFNMDSIDIEYPLSGDFEVYASTSILVSAPTYTNVFIGFNYNTTTTANIVYSLIPDGTWEIVRRVDNGVVEISTMSGATTVEDIDTIPIRIHSKKDNQSNTAILLNSDYTTGTSTPDVSIEIERGSEPNAKITWSESNAEFQFDRTIAVKSTTANGNALAIYDVYGDRNFTVYADGITELSDSGRIKLKDGNRTAILFGSDLTNSDLPTNDFKIEVERGVLTNSYIKWDETTNDRWEISSGLNVIGNTDFQDSVSLLSDVYIGNNATVDVTVVNSIATFEGIATFNSTFIQKVVVVTTAGTLNLASGAIFHLEGNGAGYTVTLPNATINGTTVHIKNVGTTQKIVDPVTNNIDGDTTGHTIKLDQNEAITLYWYSTGWWVSSIYGAVQIN